MKNILIVEDEELQSKAIEATLMSVDSNFVIHTATNSQNAASIYEANDIDLFILDVDLTHGDSDKTGIDIGKAIRQHSKYKSTPVIYITGVPEMIQSAINDVHCFNYISKPYKPKDIIKALQDINKVNETVQTAITIQDLNGVSILLDFDTIFYIQTEGHTQTFYTTNGHFCTRSNGIKYILNVLPNHFMQIHKSYIINTARIYSYDKTLCSVRVDKSDLPVGRIYKKNFDLLLNKEEFRNGF